MSADGLSGFDVEVNMKDLTAEEIQNMEFESIEKAEEFYVEYARCLGFSARKDVRRVTAEGVVHTRQMVCSRQGERAKKNIERTERSRQPRGLSRTSCVAMIRFHLNNSSGTYGVVCFMPVHNHPLTPSTHVHLIPKYRGLNEADKNFVDGLHSYGVRSCHILGYLMGQKGGHAGLGFCKKDLYNYITRSGKAKMEDVGDAYSALCDIQTRTENDHLFYCKFTLDDMGHLNNLFWCDGASRVDYSCFGEVIAFDATYKKNKYDRPLVVFCGYNHHKETTVFACALIVNEKTETYKWLLETFLDAMYQKHPLRVVTDGDNAMREAIKCVFPNASHRLCSWHIHQNALENVKNKIFCQEFSSLVYSTCSPARFESEWQRIIDEHGLSGNPWTRKVYETRKSWAAAFMRSDMFYGMRTTSMCEGLNSFVKNFVQKRSTLVDFVRDFHRALAEYRNQEMTSDFVSTYYKPVMLTHMPGLEQKVSEIFTRAMFMKVREQITNSASLVIGEQVSLGNTVVIKMDRFGVPGSTVTVCIDLVGPIFKCECQHFERSGIPCCHVFCAIKQRHMDYLPDNLVCKRWTKMAKNNVLTCTVDKQDADKLEMYRRSSLTAAFNTLLEVCCKNDSGYKQGISAMYGLINKFKKADAGNRGKNTNETPIRDPKKSNAKGAPRKYNKHKKKKNTKCGHCQMVGHDKSGCPVLHPGSDLEFDDTVQTENESIDMDVSDSLTEGRNDRVPGDRSNGGKRRKKQTTTSTTTEVPTQSSSSSYNVGHGYPHFPSQFRVNQSVGLFPNFPPSANCAPHAPPMNSNMANCAPHAPPTNSYMPGGSHNVPCRSSFLQTLGDVELKAKMKKERPEN
ncbi:protein FAR1-RELATED SEQUENCE 5-like [Trifolium pratense]|nr:protein FAR1-RELATED SEQUENCE 5-like [Trifolium pratense]